VYDPKSLVVNYVVDGLPGILLNIKGFYFLHEIKGERASNSGLLLEALPSDDEDILIVKVAH